MNKILTFLLFTLNLYASVEVSVITPEPAKRDTTFTADGVVVAKNAISITAKTTGFLNLFTYENANLNKGDKIASIVEERRTKKLALLEKNLILQKDQIVSQNLKVHDVKEMYRLGVGSQSSYLNEALILSQMQGLYENSKTEYDTLALEEKNSLILAPEECFIMNLLPENSYVGYGLPLATLVTTDTLIKLFVEADYAVQLKNGMNVAINSDTQNFDAHISHVLAQSSNNLVEVMVDSDIKLPLHTTLSATLSLKSLEGLIIPKDCIVLVDNHPAIYTIQNGIAHRVYVDILKDNLDTVLIKDTIDKESKVAHKNAYMLHDGLEVSVQ